MTDWYTALRDPSARKRIQAVKALVQTNHPQAINMLRDAYRHESDPDVKQVIKRAGSYLQTLNASSDQPPSEAAVNLTEPTTRQADSAITWGDAWGRIAIFVTVSIISAYIFFAIVFLYGNANPELMYQLTGEVYTPTEIADAPLGGILSVASVIGIILAIPLALSFIAHNYGIHLVAKYIFQGDSSLKDLLYYTCIMWTLFFVSFLSISAMLIFIEPSLWQIEVFPPLLRTSTYIVFLFFLGQRVGNIYNFGFWHGFFSVVSISLISWLLQHFVL